VEIWYFIVVAQLVVTLFLAYKLYGVADQSESNAIVIGYILIGTGLDKLESCPVDVGEL
jgi:hypothetical protein